MLERLDKIISSQGEYSRSDVKKLISSRKIIVDGVVVKTSNVKVDIEKSEVLINNKKLIYKKNLYLILNKPEGFVSSTKDKNDITVLELVPDSLYREGLFPAGRLDKNTTGLMILTDDGVFAHNILSPKKHVNKKYLVEIDIANTEDMVRSFKEGVTLIDGICKTSEMEIIDEYTSYVTLSEGRYHQIKRMFGCFGANVLKLKRVRFGNLDLPNDLNVGECRELTEEELKKIQEK